MINDVGHKESLTYFIANLPQCTVRRAFQIKQAIKYNLDLQIVKSFTPQDEEFIQFGKKLGLVTKKSEEAIVFTFYKLFEKALNSSHNVYILAEDDTEFHMLFRRKLSLLCQTLESMPDLIHLGSRGMKYIAKIKTPFYTTWPMYVKWAQGEPLFPGAPVCLLIDRKGLEKLYLAYEDWIMNNPWEPFDVILGRLYVNKKYRLKSFLVRKPLCTHSRRFSSAREALNEI